MKISDSSIQMAARWSSSSRTSETESLRMWSDNANSSLLTNENVLVDISEEGKALLNIIGGGETGDIGEEMYLLTEEDMEKIRLLENFIFVLTGKRIRFLVPKKLNEGQIRKLKEMTVAEGVSAQRPRLGWGIDYQYHKTVEEHSRMAFASTGSVTTEDGRQINFDLKFLVSRDFISSTDISIKAGDALMDPLVINFRSPSASLTDRNYYFDIDMDGRKDNIAFAAEGSGFLALDKNGNGIIDDGSELFGPSSGNGFGELAEYDLDGNNWIDENDEIYEKLRIWTIGESGEKQLIALGQAGVGAIYLGSVTSNFALKDNANNSLGQISRTGIFLHEDGRAGTIQHVDLTV
jgi:hypothetical protein